MQAGLSTLNLLEGEEGGGSLPRKGRGSGEAGAPAGQVSASPGKGAAGGPAELSHRAWWGISALT